jgi:dTDP-4-dehydrorhamnose reductase
MKKLLVFGANGLLGQSVIRRFKQDFVVISSSLNKKASFDYTDIPYYQTDLTVRYDVADLMNEVKPDIIINTAAMTDVDLCESEREAAWKVNVKAIENILESCRNLNPVIVQISADYVFDGTNAPYGETDTMNPINYYGRSKMSAENIIKNSSFEYIIARTQVLYGTGNSVRNNFVTWVINALRNNEKISVVNDQRGTPTYVHDLSEGIYKLIQQKEFGLYHISGSDSISRYDFALKIAEIFNLNADLIEEIDSEQLHQAALRPANSSFTQNKFINRTRWQTHGIADGLKLLKAELEQNG